MFNKRINLLKGPNRLLTKTQLQTMDYVYKAQPYVEVVTKNQETKNMDVVYQAQPYIGVKG
jgi:hypothetical protein